MLGTLYGLGYGKLKSPDDLAALIKGHRIDVLIDIRFHRASRFRPDWSARNTQSTVHNAGIPAYEWIEGLGNPNFRDPGHMKLSDPEAVNRVVQLLMQGYNVAIMCACSQYLTCHRQLVVRAVREQLPEVTVVHLGERLKSSELLQDELGL